MADEMAAVRGMFEDVDFTAMSLDERTFTSLNSTYLAYGIAVGAILVLLVAVGLYLYDYYYGTSRTDPVEGNFEYNQYYTDADAYQQALYEYQQAQAQYQSRYYFLKKKFQHLLCILTSAYPIRSPFRNKSMRFTLKKMLLRNTS